MNIANDTPRGQLSYCFATMAVGREYRALAELLLSDISTYCPGVPTYVLTDDRSAYSANHAVTTVPFQNTGYWFVYYGKIQAIREAMSHHDVCIFLDADCRLLGPPPLGDLLQFAPGAYGAYVQTVPVKVAGDHSMFLARGGKERWLRNSPYRQLRVYTKLANAVGVDFDTCSFLHESCLVVVGRETATQLVDSWELLGRSASSRLLEWGEGYTLGIALRLLGLRAGAVPNLSDWLFKDILLPRDERANPLFSGLLRQRALLGRSAPPSGLTKVQRLLRGLWRFLRGAPLWLIVSERSALRRVRALRAAGSATSGDRLSS